MQYRYVMYNLQMRLKAYTAATLTAWIWRIFGACYAVTSSGHFIHDKYSS